VKIDLYESQSAVFVGTGNLAVAQVEIRNDVYGTKWTVKTVQVNTDSLQTYGSSKFYLYLNSITPGGIRDSTYQGDGSTSETEIIMRAGDRLVGIWTGGDPGSNATLTIRGDKETGR
jgi:carotenoid cleavage dioxygenase-like enzyme